jgi:hypothetical protein
MRRFRGCALGGVAAVALLAGCTTTRPGPGLSGVWQLRPEASQLPHGDWAVTIALSLEGDDLLVERKLVRDSGRATLDRFRYRTDGASHRVPNGQPHEAPLGWTDDRDVVASWKGSALEVRYRRTIRGVEVPYREVWELEGPDVLQVRTTYQGDRVAQTIEEIYVREGTTPDLGAFIKRASRARECWGGALGRAAHDPSCVPRKDDEDSAAPPSSGSPSQR